MYIKEVCVSRSEAGVSLPWCEDLLWAWSMMECQGKKGVRAVLERQAMAEPCQDLGHHTKSILS